MKKMLIFGIAITLVLVSGGLFSAQAGCLSWLSPCNWHSPCAGTSHDADAAAPLEVSIGGQIHAIVDGAGSVLAAGTSHLAVAAHEMRMRRQRTRILLPL